ncbi:MAG: cupin domain-containing protein [Candidatus Thalassarchaeaceae archaeon]|nr:cupin domain-containing protein [Candidatus Thalassarchaeaceae archaeon]
MACIVCVSSPHILSVTLQSPHNALSVSITGKCMANFSHDLSDWLSISFDSEWLEENIRWKDFGTGVRLGRIAREDSTSLVLYDADPEVEVEAFKPHSHPGGEVYLVLEGEVYDEFGTYPKGSIVWMDPNSEHNPKTRERTLILVLWPDGVKVL